MTEEESNIALKTAKEITGVIENEHIFNVVINTHAKKDDTIGVYELTDDELKKLRYEDLDHSEIWLYDQELEEERYKRIWRTKEQRDVLKQRWRDIKHREAAAKAERQAKLREMGLVHVVHL